MNAYLSGVNKLLGYAHTLEAVEHIFKDMLKMHKENNKLKDFFEAIKAQDPQATSVTQENAAFYSVEGKGPNAITPLLSKCNIPHAVVENNKDGKTYIAVPKQYAAQANYIIGQQQLITNKSCGNNGEQLPPEQQELVKRIAEKRDPNNPLNELATDALTSDNVVAFETSPGMALGLQQKLKERGINSSCVTNNATGKTTVFVHKIYGLQLEQAHLELLRTPTELNRNDFMKNNLGNQIVEKTGITEAQMQHIRAGLMGSGLQYNAERQDNGTYTLRFPQKQAPVMAPAIIRSIAETNGRNKDAIEVHAVHRTEVARTVSEKAGEGQPCHVADAQHPENNFSIDKTGLRDSSGTLVVGKQDPAFEATAYAYTMRMQAPIVKDGDKLAGKGIEDVFTREEIVAAKKGAALANPDQASVLAGQVACLAVQAELAKPNADVAHAMNDAANVVKTMANGIEEEGYRLSPEELKDLAHIPGDRVPDSVKEFVDCVSKLSPDERKNLSTALNKTADSMMDGVKKRTVQKQDVSLEDIGQALDSHEKDIPSRDDTPVAEFDDNVIGVGDV